MMDRFGEKLRTLRKRQNMTLVQLADALGLNNHSHLSNIETGKRKASAELIFRIADYFDVSVDQLIRDELEV